MNKKILASALLAASASSQLSATEISNIQNEAQKNRPSASKVYLSEKTYTNKDGEFQVRVTLREAAEFDSKYVGRELPWGISLDLEMTVDYVNVKTGKVTAEGGARYIKNMGEGKLKGYNCDSSKDCSENLGSFKAFTCDSTEACSSPLQDLDTSSISLYANLLVIENAQSLYLDKFEESAFSGPIAFEKIGE